jgi:hypothetical protein
MELGEVGGALLWLIVGMGRACGKEFGMLGLC